MFFTYILQSEKSGRFYIGHTQDVEARIERHNNGQVTSTRNKGPWKLVHEESHTLKSLANKRELEIKSKKSREYILKLIGDAKTC